MNETEEFLAHFGVKGMKWGVLRDNYRATRDIPTETFVVKTKTGKDVTLQEVPKYRTAALIGAVAGAKYRQGIKDYRSFNLLADGKKVGDASFNHVSKEELNLVWLGVKSSERGKGYATSVFDAGVKYAKSKGYSKISLEVPGNAPDARHIYEKFGFKVNEAKTKAMESEEGTDDVWGGLTSMEYDIPRSRKR